MSGEKRLIYNMVSNFIRAFDFYKIVPQTKYFITFLLHLKNQFHFISQSVHVRSETFYRKSKILVFFFVTEVENS